uniref:Rab-GAP TBC domain-containing protein n=1 Tax=Haptolina brevifila TaxID=156173 RepID=A0A7S2GFW3_9EUKA|mmetsp:Transcript_36566/g.72846  ORF Transcript_36566/g.72846 Transcript_36566/m.72846 type:complete len:163 (+) Transcript_36566:216-704(+)
MPKPLLGLAADLKQGPSKGTSAALPPNAEKLLNTADEELAAKLTSYLGVTGIDAMLLPFGQRLAVGFFSAEVTAFIWDLCLLAGWQRLQPAFAAALICMRSGLLTCSDVAAIKGFIATQGTSLTIDQMQRTLELYFMPDIRKDVNAPPPQEAYELTPGGSWS